MALRISDLWTLHGTVGRTKYLAFGVILFAIKHLVDRIVATSVFGVPWGLFNYWFPGEVAGADSSPYGRLQFYATLVAIAMPFIWLGVVLTLRRLRDIGWPLWLVAVFFIPFVNLIFFALLSVIPSAADNLTEWRVFGLRSALSRFMPRGSFGSAVAGVVTTSVLAVGAAALSIYGLNSYGWGLFVGLPFALGLSSVLIYGFHEPRTLESCLLVSLLSVGVASGALIALAIEGLICVVMAAPLGAVLALFGGAVGFVIQRRPEQRSVQPNDIHAFAVVLFLVPTLMFAESAAVPEPPLRDVRTSVEIRATPEKVWQNLISFAELPPTQELLFRTGIAYPVRAEIHGRGVSAIRHCIFSTGAFVEPIEIWDEPHLLRFGVTAQPPVMEELSPYATLRPPHLDNHLRSRKGQFRLTRLPNGNTLLEGTTWYENRFWPGMYWVMWSNHIIHRIHLRVLDHIKNLAES